MCLVRIDNQLGEKVHLSVAVTLDTRGSKKLSEVLQIINLKEISSRSISGLSQIVQKTRSLNNESKR